MKILITGSLGQLGCDLVQILGSSYELYPFDIDLDITDLSAVIIKTKDIKPDLIINCAAYTNVDDSESNERTAYLVNAIGPQNLALAARQAKIPLVTFSTDFVFDGCKKEPYDEFDSPNPQCVYGRSKLAGERLTRAVLPEHYIIRTAWLFGHHGNNFVKTVLHLATRKETLNIVNDQIGSPTFSYDLAGRVAEIITTGWYGTYHVTNSGSASWFDFARSILTATGLDAEMVKPAKTGDLDRPAPRPAYSVLRNYLTELRGMVPLRPYQEALREYFS